MRKNPRGISLLLTLFVLSSILVAALSAANLIFRELKISSSSDRGIRAFYAAESGLENALYHFRALNETSLAIDETAAFDIGNGKWWRESADTIEFFNTNLLENEDIELPLFNPSAGTQAQSMRITWNADAVSCPGAQYTWLEVVQSYWNTTESQSERNLFSPSDAGGAVVNLNGSFPYVRLRALFGDACGLTLQAYSGVGGAGSPYDLPDQLKITAIGEVADTRQALTVTVPTRASQFGIFDYTLFSEQPICKDVSPCD